MTGLKRGDTVLVWFPNSDLQTFKRRPAVVVQSDQLQTGLPQIIVVMVTSNLERRTAASRIFVPLDSPEAKAAGFRTDSVIMTDNLATILLKAVAAKLGHMPGMERIDVALRTTLALE